MPALCRWQAGDVTVTAELSGWRTRVESVGFRHKECVMASNAMFAQVASLAGDPARAGMLHALMDGRALTASELAYVAHITPQTASGHLAHDGGGPASRREAGPASLPPARVAGGGADDRNHHASGVG